MLLPLLSQCYLHVGHCCHSTVKYTTVNTVTTTVTLLTSGNCHCCETSVDSSMTVVYTSTTVPVLWDSSSVEQWRKCPDFLFLNVGSKVTCMFIYSAEVWWRSRLCRGNGPGMHLSTWKALSAHWARRLSCAREEEPIKYVQKNKIHFWYRLEGAPSPQPAEG